MRSLLLLAVAATPILAVLATGPSAAPRTPGANLAEKGPRLASEPGAKSARLVFAPGGRADG